MRTGKHERVRARAQESLTAWEHASKRARARSIAATAAKGPFPSSCLAMATDVDEHGDADEDDDGNADEDEYGD